MNHKQSLALHAKSYIQGFNFASPSWDSLPMDFLRQKPENLTLGEELQYEGIKMAWAVENSNKELKRIVIRGTLSATTGTLLLIFSVCLTYYLNLNLNLGLTFLTDFFA